MRDFNEVDLDKYGREMHIHLHGEYETVFYERKADGSIGPRHMQQPPQTYADKKTPFPEAARKEYKMLDRLKRLFRF